MKITRAQLVDVAKRAGHTFWQAFAGVVGVTWAASGLDVSQITDVASAKRFGIAAGAALLAAAGSAAKSTLLAIARNPKAFVVPPLTSRTTVRVIPPQPKEPTL